MAIHEKFETSIVINNQEVKEYDDPDVEEQDQSGSGTPKSLVIRKFIESEEDQTFQIQMKVGTGQKFDKGWDTINFWCYIDDQYVGGTTFDKEQCRGPERRTQTLEGRSSDGYLERFCFTELKTVDDNVSGKFEDLKKKYGSKGTIRVNVWPFNGKIQENKDTSSSQKSISNEPVPEKALKGRAVTMSVKLAAKEPSRPSSKWAWKGKQVGMRPLVTFIFEYRTRRSLEQLLIIERPRSPTPLEDRDPSTLNETELRDLVRRQNVKMAEFAKLAELSAQIKEEHKPTVKRARQASPHYDDEIQEVKKVKENHKPTEVIDIDSD